MKRNRELLHVAVALTLTFTAFACAKKAKPDADTNVAAAASGPDTKGPRDSDSNNANGLETVHFPFNSANVESSEKDVLKHDLTILKQNPDLHVQIEGHCDQRGGSQYNLALGERRANSIRKYLTGMGVGGSRVTTISMGKEHPIDPAETEEAYAKNRRGNFVITQ